MQESTALVSIIISVGITLILSITAYNLFPPEMESISCSCGGSIQEYRLLEKAEISFFMGHAQCLGDYVNE